MSMSGLPSDLTSFLWGIGLGVIGAFGAGFLKRAGEDSYLWLKNKFGLDSNTPSVPQVIVHVSGNGENQSNEPKNASLLLPATVERVSNISFNEIAKTIENAPPLQRKQVAQNYIGLRVEWDAYFKGGRENDDESIDLRLTTDLNRPLNTIYCTVKFRDYRELGVLPENTKVRVSGEISAADRYEVTLTDVRLHFYQQDSTEQQA